MGNRIEQAAEALRQAAAMFLAQESNRTSLITVTRAVVADTLKKATIFMTVLPEKEEASALSFVKRKRGVFRSYLRKKLQLRPLPFIDFEIDRGEKMRQRLDELGLQK